MRKLLSLVALVVLSLLTVSLVSAASLDPVLKVTRVEINDEEVERLTPLAVGGPTWSPDGFDPDEPDATDGDETIVSALAVEEGETLDIEVTLEANADVRDVQVEADIRGYEYSDYDDLSDETHVFDMHGTATAPSTKSVRLSLTCPGIWTMTATCCACG